MEDCTKLLIGCGREVYKIGLSHAACPLKAHSHIEEIRFMKQNEVTYGQMSDRENEVCRSLDRLNVGWSYAGGLHGHNRIRAE